LASKTLDKGIEAYLDSYLSDQINEYKRCFTENGVATVYVYSDKSRLDAKTEKAL
jgi:hypothetical protein